MNKGSAESSKPAPRVSEFRSTQVYPFLNYIHPFSSYGNVYKSQISSMLSSSSRLSTAATLSIASSVTSHARSLAPHLSIYKPQSNSMYSIFSRIAASIISGVALLFYVFSRIVSIISDVFDFQ
ncbi:putative fumarate reductase/succinate dehydrogenase, transmembrane subunit [Helianthus annuus]|nr:putative fumarate reductase/succinate dehydrogenase, transmembrane subunit [Helianthus annuus]